MPMGAGEPGSEIETAKLEIESEIIPPEENITNGETTEGEKYNLVVASDENPEKISSWITNKSGDRIGTINYGNDGLEATKEEFRRLESNSPENKD